MASEGTETISPQDVELTGIQRQIQIAESRTILAKARRQLAEAEGTMKDAVIPWWKSGFTVTSLAAIISAVVPLTAQIQSWKEQALKEREKNYELRDKYFNAVLRDARQEQRVLEFIVATADDEKIGKWAQKQLENTKAAVVELDKTAPARKQLYSETIQVVADLASKDSSQGTWETSQKRFWELYENDLLPVESQQVESLMVQIGVILKSCNARPCPELQDLAYRLARQMKTEIQADDLADAQRNTKSR